jgi:hypothetical protein
MRIAFSVSPHPLTSPSLQLGLLVLESPLDGVDALYYFHFSYFSYNRTLDRISWSLGRWDLIRFCVVLSEKKNN